MKSNLRRKVIKLRQNMITQFSLQFLINTGIQKKLSVFFLTPYESIYIL